MAKFYAVKKGYQTGIFTTWDECQKQTKGYSGAIFKSFKTKIEAENFLQDKSEQHTSTEASHYTNYAYVDGSFDASTGVYGSGIIIHLDGKIIEKKIAGNHPLLAQHRNVTGEIEGVIYVIKYALEHHIKDLTIFYDYMGIEQWATKKWQANNDFTKFYTKFTQEALKKININFIKVAAHTGIELNEKADQLAKEAVQEFIQTQL